MKWWRRESGAVLPSSPALNEQEKITMVNPDLELNPYLAARTARHNAWVDLGSVETHVVAAVHNTLASQTPLWPSERQAFLRIQLSDSVVFASDGLTDPYSEGSHIGTGVELYLETRAKNLVADPQLMRDSVHFNLLFDAAQDSADAGSEMAEAFTEYGVMSMQLRGSKAEESWLNADGDLGLLLGVPAPGIPTKMVIPGGTIRVASVTPIRPDELAYVLANRATGRLHIVEELVDQGYHHYADFNRPSVLD
ncbi:MAG: hypothetical protein ACRCSF_07235 [Mycobacteriaceae bacterium]